MKPEHWINVAQIVCTVAALFIGPWWAVRRSLKQFRSQKWWEKKQETYSQLLEDLSLLQYYYGNSVGSIEMQRDYEPLKEFMDLVHRAQQTLEKHAAIGEYLLSAEAAKSVRSLQKAMCAGHTDAHAYFEMCFQEAQDSLESVKKEAKKALQ